MAMPEVPESVQATSAPLVTAKFIKKIDKEFALQAPVMVDGPGRNGKEVSTDEESERTVDGLSAHSQAIMQTFINDQSDDDEPGPPSYNPVLEQVDKEMTLRRLTEANITMFKQIRRRRVLDDDDDEVPILRVETSTPAPPPSSAQHTNTATNQNQTQPINSANPKGAKAAAAGRSLRAPASKSSDGKNATAKTGGAGSGSK